MKHLFLLTFLIPALFCASSCTRKASVAPVAGDYVIIGHPGAFVASPIVTYYVINKNSLKKDVNVNSTTIPDDVSKFNFNISCPAAQYDKVKNLINSVPAELLTKNNQHIGEYMPDAGYTDIRVSMNGVSYRWYFEGIQTGSSNEVKQFVSTAEQVFQ